MLKTLISIALITPVFLMTSVSAVTPQKTTKKVSVKVPLQPAKMAQSKVLSKVKKSSKEKKDNTGGFGITGKVSTLGLGVDLTYGIMDKLNARFNINGGSLDASGEQDGINYDGSLDLQSIGGVLDYHPTGGEFRLSVGLYNNGNKIDLDGSAANKDAKIGDITYDLSNAKLNPVVSFKSTAPYLGIGWGNAVDKKSKFSITTDLGVLFQGAPVVELTASGNVIPKSGIHTGPTIDLEGSSDAAKEFRSELQKEQDNLNNDENLKKFKLFPVVSLGFNYRF